MISIDKLSKKYRKHKVLNNVSLEIADGEFVSIVGSSGAGKTTLLHALIGANKVESGKIIVNGQEISAMNNNQIQDYRRKIGIVFQDYKLLPKKTVFENVAFALEVSGYEEDFIAKRVVDVLKITGLEEHRNHFPSQISGGEKQRTAIARALVHAPNLLFADEPTGNLDPENTIALAKLLKAINKSGTTIVISTHDKTVVNHLKERVVKLDNGKIISDKKKAGYDD